MTGERSAFRDVDFPDNFEDWPENARVQFLRRAIKKPQLRDYIAQAADLDDQSTRTPFTKDQLTELAVWVAEHNGDMPTAKD